MNKTLFIALVFNLNNRQILIEKGITNRVVLILSTLQEYIEKLFCILLHINARFLSLRLDATGTNIFLFFVLSYCPSLEQILSHEVRRPTRKSEMTGWWHTGPGRKSHAELGH